MASRTVSVALKAEVTGLVNGFKTGANAAKQFNDELANLGSESPGKLNDIALAAGGLGATLLGIAGYATHAAMAFDKQMSEVSSVSKATGADLQRLRDLAIEAGKQTSFSATEAAAAEAELAKAGIATADIMGGALKGALALAEAGQMGLADAATIAAQSMNMFELKGKDVTHIADVLASAANTSAADMHGLGMGLQQVGLVAHQAGFSLEETVGVLAAFADRGLEGSDGATSLKTAIQRLTAPTEDVAKTMGRLGIEVYDANGNVKTAAQLAGNLQKSLGGLSVEERNAALNTIFGADAIRAANVLYGLGEDGVNKYTKAVDQQGAAADTAAEKMNNLAGDLEKLKGSIETLAIESGSSSTGGLRFLTKAADEMVGSLSEMNPAVSGTVQVVAGLSGAGLLAFAAMAKVRASTNDALGSLREMGPTGERAARGLGRVAVWAGRAGVAMAVAQVAGALLGAALGREAPNVDRMATALEKYATTGERAGELTKVFGNDFQRFGKDVKFINSQGGLKDAGIAAEFENLGGLIPILGKFDFSVTKTLERMHGLDEGLANMVKNGRAKEAAQMFEILAAQANNNGVSMDKFKAMLPGYTGAIGDLATATDGAAQAQGAADHQARAMAGGLQEAMKAAGGLKKLFDELNGTQINLTQAQINAEAAVDNLTEALKKSEGGLDLNTEAGRAAMQAGVDLAETAAEVAQKTYDQTHNVEQASTAFNAYRQQLIQNIATAGGTKQATDESRRAAELLASQIMQMPAFKKIDIQMPGIDAATEKVIGLQTKLNGLQDRTITVTTVQNTQTGETRTQTSAGPRFNRWGGLYQHAQTGLLRDAGIYSAASPARYAFAEPATGGEAFVPKNGDYGRSMSILSQAASWYGARVMPGGGGGATVVNTFNVTVNGGMGVDGYQLGQQFVEQALRPFIQRNGNNVQMAIVGRP